MKDGPRDLNRIPKEKLTAYERWELPLLDARGNEVAREEERDVKPLTAADLTDIRQAAREDGFNEGRQDGYQAGFEKGQAEGHEQGREAGMAEGREQGEQQAQAESQQAIQASLERLEQVMAELVQPIQRHGDEIETALVNLTTSLARAVLFRELTIDSSQIQQVVRRALATLPSTADNVRIHIHPDDCELVREVTARLEAPAAVVSDDAILPGGCRVETRHSLVDFTVEKRFQRAVQNMLDQQMADSESGETEELDSLMGDMTDFHRDVLNSPADDDQPTSDAGPDEGDTTTDGDTTTGDDHDPD